MEGHNQFDIHIYKERNVLVKDRLVAGEKHKEIGRTLRYGSQYSSDEVKKENRLKQIQLEYEIEHITEELDRSAGRHGLHFNVETSKDICMEINDCLNHKDFTTDPSDKRDFQEKQSTFPQKKEELEMRGDAQTLRQWNQTDEDKVIYIQYQLMASEENVRILTAENEELKEQKRREFEKLNRELQATLRGKEKLELELQRIQDRLNKVETKSEQLRQQEKETHSAYKAELTRQIKKLKEENERMRQDVKSSTNTIKKLTQERETIRFHDPRLNTRIESTQVEQTGKLQKDIQQLEDKVEKAQTHVKTLQNKEKTLEKENDMLREKIDEQKLLLIKQNDVTNAVEVKKLNREREASELEFKKLKTRLESEMVNARKLQQEVDILKARINETQDVEKTLKMENDTLRRQLGELENKLLANTAQHVGSETQDETKSLKEQLQCAHNEIEATKRSLKQTEENLHRYQSRVETLQIEKNQAVAEKNSALTRLSALAGDRLRDNNAAIADLSDDNRPINLGEKFSELYDNQWTDAMENLEGNLKMTELNAIQCLLRIIQAIFRECEKLAKDQLSGIAKAAWLPSRMDVMKRIKDFRKSIATEVLPEIKKCVNDQCLTVKFGREMNQCKSYISRAVELCWYMQIQDPPVILDFSAKKGDVFDDKIYRHFTKSGKKVDYMVWPVMYLHINGPLLQKGVVQPM